MIEARPRIPPAELARIRLTATKDIERKRQKHATDTARQARGGDVVMDQAEWRVQQSNKPIESWTHKLTAAAKGENAAAYEVHATTPDRAEAEFQKQKQERAEKIQQEEQRAVIARIESEPTAHPDTPAPAHRIADKISTGKIDLGRSRQQLEDISRQLDTIMEEINTGNFGVQVFREGNVRESSTKGIIESWRQNHRRKKGEYEKKILTFQRLQKNERLLKDALKVVVVPPPATEALPPLLDAKYLTELSPEPPKPGLGETRAVHLPRTTFGEVEVTRAPPPAEFLPKKTQVELPPRPALKFDDLGTEPTVIGSQKVVKESVRENEEDQAKDTVQNFLPLWLEAQLLGIGDRRKGKFERLEDGRYVYTNYRRGGKHFRSAEELTQYLIEKKGQVQAKLASDYQLTTQTEINNNDIAAIVQAWWQEKIRPLQISTETELVEAKNYLQERQKNDLDSITVDNQLLDRERNPSKILAALERLLPGTMVRQPDNSYLYQIYDGPTVSLSDLLNGPFASNPKWQPLVEMWWKRKVDTDVRGNTPIDFLQHRVTEPISVADDADDLQTADTNIEPLPSFTQPVSVSKEQYKEEKSEPREEGTIETVLPQWLTKNLLGLRGLTKLGGFEHFKDGSKDGSIVYTSYDPDRKNLNFANSDALAEFIIARKNEMVGDIIDRYKLPRSSTISNVQIINAVRSWWQESINPQLKANDESKPRYRERDTLINTATYNQAKESLNNLLAMAGVEEANLPELETVYADSEHRPDKLKAMNDQELNDLTIAFSEAHNTFSRGGVWDSDPSMREKAQAIDLLLTQEVVRRSKEKRSAEQRVAA